MADVEEQGCDRFRFTEVYRPVFAKMVSNDPDLCITVIEAFSNASHFSITSWRIDQDDRRDDSNGFSMHSRDADALAKVMELESLRDGDVVFHLTIAAPKYLCDRVLTELEVEMDVKKEIKLEAADFSGQHTIKQERNVADKGKS